MTRTTTLATAIRRKDWERAALMLLIGLLEAARNAPPGTIDDVLTLLSAEDALEEPQISQISQMTEGGEPPSAQKTQRKRSSGGGDDARGR